MTAAATKPTLKSFVAAVAARMLDTEIANGTLSIPQGRCWLVIGPHVWGKAFSPRQAWENAEKPESFLLFDAPPCATVDGMGGITWYPTLYSEKSAPARTRTNERFGIRYAAKCVRAFKDGAFVDPETLTKGDA